MRADSELLNDYVLKNSEGSFSVLVDRYLDLVYSVAHRSVRSPEIAEEVAQSTFLDLARKAHSLPPDTILSAWLYRVARRTAIDAVRRESRRLLREQVASQLIDMNAIASEWAPIEPLLDEAMDTLDDSDRSAVLLRYFENKSLREVGQALGTSEDAAQKRVGRAVDRLREFFTKRGVPVAASGLVALISAHAVQAAPFGLNAAISAAVLAGGAIATAGAASTTVTVTKTIAMTALQKTLLAGTIAVTAVATPLAIHHYSQAKLHLADQALRQENDELSRLKIENERLSQLLASSNTTPSLPSDDFRELLRLRNEVGNLRRETKELGQQLADSQRTRPTRPAAGTATSAEGLPKESWTFAGYADPELAFQSTIWAMSQGDTRTFLASLVPGGAESKKWEDKTEDEVASKIKGEFEKVTAFKILGKEFVNDDEILLSVFANGIEEGGRFRLMRMGQEWKLAGPVKGPPPAGEKTSPGEEAP